VLAVLAADPASAMPDDSGAPWWERSVWDNPARSYEWYPPEPAATPVPPPAPAARPPIRSLTTIRAIREELERLRDEAVMHPSPDNVRTYLDAQQFVMGKGSTFADVARRVVWAHAELDYGLQRPTQALAIDAFRSSRREAREQVVARLARDHGLFFLFRGDCPYCHRLAPILRGLEAQYGLEVFAVSLDGGTLPEYPRPHPDNGIARVLGVAQVPAIFLGSKTERRVQALGHGVLSAEEILERLYVLTQRPPGEDF
jgi:conjugal transfer pilus assembly protein TraF